MSICPTHLVPRNLCGCHNRPAPQVGSPGQEILRGKLAKIHELRMRAHWGKNYDPFAPGRWPQNDREWRQTEHGAPWDTNVEMAKWHFALAGKIKEAGLLD